LFVPVASLQFQFQSLAAVGIVVKCSVRASI
jgi:hypothetical protein